MTSIIPTIAPPAGSPNVSAPITPGAGTVIPSGTTYYSNGANNKLFSAFSLTGFSNAGTLWINSTSNVSGVLSGFYLYGLSNSGTWVAQASDGNAYALSIADFSDTMDNSGTMLALTAKGNAIAVEGYWPYFALTNSGIIAAQALATGSAGVGDAVGVALFNGGHIVNQAGASILGEGQYGRAILMGRGTQFNNQAEVINHGLIAAQTLDANHPAIAITLDYLSVESARIVNDGTIRADIAIQTSQTDFNPYAVGGSNIHNLAGGSIIGALDLQKGDDLIVNAGTITGIVATGDGNDVFDTSAGTWNGTGDLGWNDDIFVGSAGNDVVKGNRGSDTLTGNGGNDLLLGGTGNDLLTGGAGNDGLYGESGDDVIVTQSGDAAFGGDGDDHIRAGDLTFARIDGGAGNDTLELTANGLRLDLSAALTTGRLTGIEAIALGTDQQVAVRAGDATTLGGSGKRLTFTGDGSDRVLLVGGWTQGADISSGGSLFHAYALGNETVLVAANVAVTLGATPGAAFTGLGAIAAGSAAPVAGSIAGGELTNAVQTSISATVDGLFIVDADETWIGTDRGLILGANGTLINHGTLTASMAQNAVLNTIGGNYLDMIVNTGTIRATGTGQAFANAAAPSDRARIDNSGLIEAVADQGRALAAVAQFMSSETTVIFANSGTVRAQSQSGAAIGAQLAPNFIFDHGSSIGTNDGLVSATGGAGTIGLQFLGGGRFVNNATIVATNTAVSGAHDAVGVQMYTSSSSWLGAYLDNRGTITATTAVRGDGGTTTVSNSGEINGDVRLGSGDDTLLNSGSINGVITLGDGRDYFDGTLEQHHVTVAGEGGGDILIGGVGDTLDGGAGDDVLVAHGADTLTGGAGADDFVFSPLGTGSSITDFVSGTDRIDLSGLAPSDVSLAVSGGNTILSATTPSGLFTLQITGVVAQTDIFTISLDAGTAGSDTLVASAAGSALHGLGGADLLVGMGGNDTLDGGAGADLMLGGTGDDTYVVDSGADVVRELAGAGNDTIVNMTGTYLALPDNVERMTGGSGGGNVLDNVLIGSDGNDQLSGIDAGNDTLIGGLGDDTYTVEGQNDLVIEGLGQGNDTVRAYSNYYLPANIENLFVAEGADNFFGVGNDLANVITADYGSNLLIAGGGNDLVHGGRGADSLFGQDGDDQLFGDEGVDYLVGGDGADMLQGGNQADALYGGDGNDILWGDLQATPVQAGYVPQPSFDTDILVGGNGNDILHGDSLLGDYDLMDGGAGDDTYYVDTPADLTFEAAGGGTDTVYANISGAGYYLYPNVENLVLLGTTPYGVGNELDNHLTGNDVANWLLGGAGNDVLNGKGGNDVLFGEAGADTFVFEHGTGGDVIGDFLAGTDKIDLSAFGFASFAQVQAAMGQNGGDSFINLGGGDFIVLNGVAQASLHAGDFILGSGTGASLPGVTSVSHASTSSDIGRGDYLASVPSHLPAGDLLF